MHEFNDKLLEGTYTTAEENQKTTFTMQAMVEALKRMKPIPKMPEVWYSKHLGPDVAFRATNQITYSLTKTSDVLFVGKNVAVEMLKNGIHIENYTGEDDDD